MPHDRDVAAFHERAPRYEDGWLGRVHREIADRTAALALAESGTPPMRVLDVGCGTGYLLRRLADRCPGTEQLTGVDAAPGMIEVAEAATSDQRVRYLHGVVEDLPFPDETFDLVVTTTSFDHWSDQLAGLRECARVLTPAGHFVLVDMFSGWMVPTLLARRGRARTKRHATRLLLGAGFHAPEWHDLYAVIIRAATATRLPSAHTP